MTALSRTPENTNLLQPTKYLLTFDRIGAVQYFCQEANIPGVSMAEAPMKTPFHNYTIAGLNLNYNKFKVTFMIDEKAQSWINIYEWFLAMSSPESFEERNYYQNKQNEYKNTPLKSYSNAILTVLSNLNNPILRVQFEMAFPTSLSDISFSTKESAENILTAEAEFSFEYFKFLPI